VVDVALGRPHYPFAVLELPVRALPAAADVADTRPAVKIQLSHPDVASDLVDALNATDCLAARIAADTVEVLVPWLSDGADARQAATELRFFVRAWGIAHPGVRAVVSETG
jgi:hypothetical protein